MISVHRDPSTVRKSIPISKAKLLGRVGDDEYFELADHEYCVGLAPASMTDYAIAPNEIWLSTRSTRDVDGTSTTAMAFRRGLEVGRGTFDRLTAAEAASTARRERKLHPLPKPVNVLAALPALHGRPGTFFPPATRPGGPEWLAARSGAAVSAGGSYVPPTPAVNEFSAILARYQRRGVRFVVLASGSLLAEAPAGKLSPADIDALERLEKFLVAEIEGRPLPCEGYHRERNAPAVTLVAPAVGACAEHAAGTLPWPAP